MKPNRKQEEDAPIFNLKELYSKLKGAFDIEQPMTRLDGQMDCYTFPFFSQTQGGNLKEGWLCSPEENALVTNGEGVNHQFRYAVFSPARHHIAKGAIVLLHGLNERNWEKYLPWAYELARSTGKPVILFPIAHHMNRAPHAWGVPRPMHQLAGIRQHRFGKINNSSFVNAAISCRLDYSPELFVTSGLQSLIDLMALSTQIKEGHHPLFMKETQVDFFAYSIGAFLTEILLMANPMGLYTDSKAFFFCGGSTFDLMDGRSKSILDDRAFGSLREYLLASQVVGQPPINTLDVFRPALASLWNAFLSMLTLEGHRSFRERALKKMAGKIAAIGLKIDKVIPGAAIQKTLGRALRSKKNVTVAHFNYPYTHETPFPLLNNKAFHEVEQAFYFTFQRAGAFLG